VERREPLSARERPHVYGARTARPFPVRLPISAANATGASGISGPTFTIDDAALSMSSSDAGLVPSAVFGAADAVGAAKSVPIAPGQLDITANVVVVFELK